MNNAELRRLRWRLVLGSTAEASMGGLSGEWADRDRAMAFLYDRELQGTNIRSDQPCHSDDRTGSLDPSALTVPDWINAIHELFPQKTIDRLEKDALERYHLAEMVTNPDLLARVQPSETLLKTVLQTKHLMNQEVLTMARDLVRKVVEQLMEKLARPIQNPFNGQLNRRQRSYIKIASIPNPSNGKNSDPPSSSPTSQNSPPTSRISPPPNCVPVESPSDYRSSKLPQ